MSNIVDLATRQPLAMSSRQRNHRVIDIDPEIVERLREVDPTKLLGYLGLVLPVDEPDFQVKFVLDRDGWLRDCIAILHAAISEQRSSRR